LVRGFNEYLKGSEVTVVPGAIVTSGFPLNLRARSVVESIAQLSLAAAICTILIVTGFLLNSFENLTRKLSPPIETRTICLIVLLLNPGAGGLLFGSTSWGAVAHVPTHFSVCLFELTPVSAQQYEMERKLNNMHTKIADKEFLSEFLYLSELIDIDGCPPVCFSL
jgi:hypothetical protein